MHSRQTHWHGSKLRTKVGLAQRSQRTLYLLTALQKLDAI